MMASFVWTGTILAVVASSTTALTYRTSLQHRPLRSTFIRRSAVAAAVEVDDERYSIPDQPARFARAKREDNERYLDIVSVYDPSYLVGKRVAVTGANRGIGLALARELTHQGARVVAVCRTISPDLERLAPEETVLGVDVASDEACEGLPSKIKGGPIDILINNAGYFYEPLEKIDSLNFKEERKMVDICALGPLRITSALYNAGLLTEGSVVIMITSQGGSISWRTTQNPTGGDYGHHMSKAAANMMAVLLSQELKGKNIPVGILHPGFNKSDMTAKYSDSYEEEGAVDPAVGAKRILHETGKVSMETTGKFVNCEDGLEIPW